VRMSCATSSATFASSLNVDVPAIAAMLNHSDLSTAPKYIHRNNAADAARERVREALRPAKGVCGITGSNLPDED